LIAEKTDALVIRQTDYSESSRIVVLYSRDFGKISTIAKGGRRLKGPFDAALDLLARSRIVFLRKSSGSLDILTESQLITRFIPPKNNLRSLYGGYYIAELLNALTEEYSPDPQLFDAAVLALESLMTGERTNETLLLFEFTLLRELGHLPAFDECIACRDPLEGQTGPLSLWVSQGGMLCPKCRKDEYAKNTIHPGTLTVLHQLSLSEQPVTNPITVSPQQHRELRTIATAMISDLLSRRPKMARYLQL